MINKIHLFHSYQRAFDLPDDSIHDKQVPHQTHRTDQAVGGSNTGGQDEAGGVPGARLLSSVSGSQQLLRQRGGVEGTRGDRVVLVPLPAWQVGGILHVDGEARSGRSYSRRRISELRGRDSQRVRDEHQAFSLPYSLNLYCFSHTHTHARTLTHSLTHRVY